MDLRDYTFLGTTRSLCPHCRRLVDAKIITRQGRVYFRKRCPQHGTFDDFVCSDVAYYDRHEHSQPARLPKAYGTHPDKGCPYDCGLCTEHEQHTCIALVEVTSNCNLRCPMCFAESGPGGQNIDFATYQKMVDRYVYLEGVADVLQLSGGEPTLHPELVRMVRYAYEQPIQVVMINTNGIRLAHDPALVEALAAMRDRFEVYLQFDGLEDRTYTALRGERLLDVKLAALEALRQHDIRCTLVCTVDHNTNLHEVGEVVKFGLERPHVRGVSFQLATYCGRHLDPRDLERRATMPDVVKGIVAQTGGLVAEGDFYPLPCAHPNCHLMCYLYRGGARPVPINRIIDVTKHMDLIANSVVYTPARARQIVARYLEASGGCGCGPGGCGPTNGTQGPALDEFVVKALAEKLGGSDVFRITLTAFLDVHNFDTRRVMKCCLAHLLPSGHVVPFCAYNTLYRDGHVPLPPLADAHRAEPLRQSLTLVSP
ncbi:MAG: radical SAM protein [Gemmataceae bacterium]|nr:radical SAM protein [Gemmataceae bacterium]